jgi:PAS domain S-box-containing protein
MTDTVYGFEQARQVPDTGFLAGGGELGERIRLHDWSATPLGPIFGWPQSLRSVVSLCVKSRFPIIIHWGWPDLLVLYNDAFIPLIGDKHPKALGRPLFESWPELRPTIESMLESVLTTGKAALSEDLLHVYNRTGYLEERYLTVSFNPIALESGRIGGSFSLIDNTTDRVIGERRLRTLRDLAAGSGDAKETEEACRIAADVLAENRYDLPIALLYFIEKDSKRARLVASVGLDAGGRASPPTVELTDQETSEAWPLARVLATNQPEHVDDLEERFGPLSGGPWNDSPKSALVIPITPTGHSVPAAILVAGISPRRALDDAYRTFLNSVATQIGATLMRVIAYQSQAELDGAKTMFFSNASHEFRTPLTLLLGPLEEIVNRRGSSLEQKDREALDLAHRNGLRLQKLVNSLLDFSRIEAGRLTVIQESTDVGALTADLASVFRAAIERAGMRLVVDSPSLLGYVDREMWEKIVLNLVSNAFKYTFEGEIKVALREVGENIELSVSDSGIGIPEKELPHIFERFRRVEGARGRSAEGTGIGLALVQELVKLHGGTIRADSRVGQGSVFTVFIPRRSSVKNSGSAKQIASTVAGARVFLEEALRWLPDTPSGTHSMGPSVSGTAEIELPGTKDGRGKARILFVDDNADVRNYVSALLDEHYDVTAAADGEMALTKLRQSPPDLVLTDIMMPGLDGFELLKAIRCDPVTSTIPVILLTARAGEESTVKGLEGGADDYLTKPFSAKELTARVAAHVALARLRKETLELEQIAKSEAQLRQIVDAIPEMIGVLNTDGTVLYANQTMLDYTGLTVEEVMAPDSHARVFHLEDIARLHDERRKALLDVAPFKSEQRIRRKDGLYRWFLIQYNPLLDDRGQVIRWYATATDIDDRVRAEERIRNENLALREQIERDSMFEDIVGSSQPLRRVLSQVSKVAPSDSTVLILGETGTGKELIARAIHKRSSRAARAFIPVNCAAITPSLIASELFGHEKGAFTGATQRRLGRFEAANGGTIFLDEVGDLPPEIQIALLRVLQEREIERVGSDKPISVDVRIVAATHRDLNALVAEGRLRQDLLYRLNVVPIEMPSLRERATDIPVLVEYFIHRFGRKNGKKFRTIDKKTLRMFQSYAWPGNVRELQNVVERAVILSDGDHFSVDQTWLKGEPPQGASPTVALNGALLKHEKEMIEAALAESHGRISGPTGAAARLRIPRGTLEAKIKRLGINKYQFKVQPSS